MSRGKTKHTLFTNHNKARLISGGRGYFDCLEALIDNAKETIHLQTYIYDEDETGNRIAEALINAAQRGLKVYILLDGYASQNLSSEFINRLKDAGIFFDFFEPLFRSRSFYFGRRLHYKVAVADASACLVGGRNISNRYNDMPGIPAWLDWAVFAEGEVAAGLQNVCINTWNHNCEHNQRISFVATAPGITGEECHIRIRINDWVNKKTEVMQSYMQMFGTAQTEVIVMTSYFWPGRKLVKKMAAAAYRGVKVKLVLASISDIRIAKYAERYMYRWLFRKNIEIYEYNKNVLHGKIAVCDKKWVTIGSYNVNNLSAYASLELNLDVMNEDFATVTHQKLSEIIANDCTLVTKDAYTRKYRFINRVFQKAAFIILNIIFFIFTFYFRQHKRAI